MRFMIIVKATADSEAGVMPVAAQLEEMAAYHEELSRAGVLVDASGLHPSSRDWRVQYRAGGRQVVEGPFAEAKEIIAGYTILRVDSREQAMEWVNRFPNPATRGEECEIEVRQMFELEDFEQGSGVERFRKLGVGGS